MAKYYIESYKKEKQSFLGLLNSHSHDGDFKQPAGYTEPYTITLKKVGFLGITKTIEKKVRLPKGFNHKKELTKGREWLG